MSRMIRWSATVLVCVCLTAGAAQAWPVAQVRADFTAPEVGVRLEAAWSWLVSLFRPTEPKPPDRLSHPQTKGGCTRDPNGQPCT